MSKRKRAAITIPSTFELVLEGRVEEADASCAALVARLPPSADLANLRGVVAAACGRLTQALSFHEQALARDPELIEARNNMGVALVRLGRADEALVLFRRALEAKPPYLPAFDNLLLASLCSASLGPADVARLHRSWGQMVERQIQPLEPVSGAAAFPPPPPGQPLRIGYVSADLKRHPVASFLEPVLASHDRSRFCVFAYATLRRSDDVTHRLRAHVDTWRDVTRLDDGQLARQIAADRIDVLVDLSGHTIGHRLGAFARRPAPVQVTYLGYPATTGLSRMDVRLTDPWADPPGATEHLHTERLVRLEDGFLCYQPPAEAGPPPARPPSVGRGHVTFGSFNDAAKISPRTVALWARILREVPDARLRLKAKAFDDAGARARLEAAFAAEAVEPTRLEWAAHAASFADHLASYDAVDVALDPAPYGGTTTTCEALWMGVPVITLAGPSHVSRVGASLLSRVGLKQLVADGQDGNDGKDGDHGYVAAAAGLARDPQRLGALRAGLRERMAASSVLDGRRFTRALEDVYIQLRNDPASL